MMLQEVTCGTRARTEEGTLEESLLGDKKKKKRRMNNKTLNSPTTVFLYLTMVHIMKLKNNENGL